MSQEEKRSSTSAGAGGAAPPEHDKKPLRLRKRVRVTLRRVAIWLDAWGLRGYPQDTHDWPSKVERFRSMKTTSRHLR